MWGIVFKTIFYHALLCSLQHDLQQPRFVNNLCQSTDRWIQVMSHTHTHTHTHNGELLLLLLLLSRFSRVWLWDLCDPIDGSPPGSPILGILQARTLEWVAISFSNAWKWKVKVKSLSRVWLFETPWTAAHQAPPSMGFFRQEYWSGVPLPSPNGILLSHKK